MGVYNGEKYIRESIESILNQTYKNFELIICDDGSKDKSLEIINEYQKKDNRIIVIKNEKNLGLAASLNNSIKMAKGEYIARMDCDDIAVENRLEKQVDFLDKHEEYAFVGSSVKLFDNNGVWGERINPADLPKELVFTKQPIVHPTTMIRRNVLELVNGYTVAPYTYRTEDFDLWCKIYSKGFIGANIKDVLLYYREDKDSYNKRKFKYRIDAYKLKKMWRKKLGLPYKYHFYSYKPIIIGLIPRWLIRLYHDNKYKV